MDLINHIYNELKSNQLLMTLVGVSGAGMITFWLRDFPKRVLYFFKREFITELTITSQNLIFYEFLKWIEKNYGHKNFRRLKVANGYWGHSSNVITSIGYGNHFIRHKNKLFFINLQKESANQTDRDKETITISAMGRSRKTFYNLIKEIKSLEKDMSKIEIYRYDNGWSHVKDQAKRDINSVFIEKEKKDDLIKNLTRFIENEEWYTSNGIPYQLGILLYGPPGTGKTSLIKAIAGYLNYPIYYLSTKNLGKIEQAVSNLPDKSIMVIEDIDANSLTHSRGELEANGDREITLTTIDEEKKEDQKSLDLMKLMASDSSSLSEVLNSLDGMFSSNGRILISTTNHIENLDAALIRPGRFDLKIEIGYVDNEIAEYFIDRFFFFSFTDEERRQIRNMEIKPKLTIAMLQNLLLQGKDKDDIIDFLKTEDSR